MPAPSSPPRVGAYGLSFLGTSSASSLLVPTPEVWPLVRLERRRGRVLVRRTYLDDETGELALTGESALALHRAPGRAVFRTPEPLSDAELVHPYLAPVGAVFARWGGREAFHAGAFRHGGGVWALIGGRASGKSSTLAWLALAGHEVLCDDLLVVNRGMALAGPRCVDLRASGARQLGVGELLGVRGPRERWRMVLGPVPPELPVQGWVFLQWGEAVDIVRLSGRERLTQLAANRSILLEATDPEVLLDLAALPAWRLTRPRHWSSLPSAVDRLLDVART